MRVNSFRGRVRSGGRIRIRQSGSGVKRVSMSVPRGTRVNLRIRQG